MSSEDNEANGREEDEMDEDEELEEETEEESEEHVSEEITEREEASEHGKRETPETGEDDRLRDSFTCGTRAQAGSARPECSTKWANYAEKEPRLAEATGVIR